MLHQRSCPYTPQQNARVERKHRNVLKMARALRFQSGLSLSFWGDCVLTAVYIINRIPSAALNFKVPYEELVGEKVDCSLFKVFGCLAIAYNASHGTDKFAPRGIPSIFVGYPTLTKGYRLLDIKTMKPFVSRHVIFHEKVFPLNSNSTEAYVQTLPVKTPEPKSGYYDDELVEDTETTQDVDAENEADEDEVDVDEATEEITHTTPRRSSRAIKQPTWLKDFVTPSAIWPWELR